MQVKLVIPIRIPFTMSDGDQVWEKWLSSIKQLPRINSKIQSQYLISDFSPKFQIEKKISEKEKAKFYGLYQNQGWMKRWTDASAYLVSKMDLPFKPISELKKLLAAGNFNHDSPSVCREVSLRRVSHLFKDLIFDLSVTSNIASVGALRFDDGALFCRGHSFPVTSVTSQCDGLIDYSISNSWPPIRTANLQEVFDWYRSLSGTINGHSDSPASRAACAFSYLFHPDVARRAMMDLIWSLAGIEALLGEADQSRRLITDKLLLLFPSGQTNDAPLRKLVRELYDFRSRMLHGNRNISARRIEYSDDDLTHKKYVLEEEEATDFAILLLSQLLLHCYRTGLREIKTNLVLAQ
jgi:hypothetical protein